MARKTKEEALLTRDRILDAAEQVFHTQGVAATSLQQIAAEAGVTRGAVYHHFQDKHEIIEGMLARVTLPLEADMAATLGTPGAPEPRARLVTHVRKLFAYITHTPQAKRVFDILTTRFEYGAAHEPLRRRKHDSRCEFRDQLAATVAHAQACGELAAAPPAGEIAISLLALIDGLIRSWILEPDSFDLERVGATAVQRLLDGFSPR